MKKWISLLLAVVLMLTFAVGCGKKDDAKTTEAAKTESGDKAAETAGEKSTDGAASEKAADPGSDIDYPTKPISLIIPAGAGGDTDINSRIFAKYLEKELGQTIVVQNVKGGGGSVATRQCKDAAPDGYTVMMHHPGLVLNNLFGIADYSFDAFSVINIPFADSMSCWVVSKDSPFKTVEELVAYAKENEVSFATEVGSQSHLTMVDFERKTGAKLNMVDAGGSADKITALLGGQLDVMFSQVGLITDYIESGDFIVLGIMSAERNPLMPELPTFKEQGVDLVFDKPYIFFTTPGVDEAIVAKLEAATEKVMKNPDFAKELEDVMKTSPGTRTREESIKYYEELTDQYKDILKDYKAE